MKSSSSNYKEKSDSKSHSRGKAYKQSMRHKIKQALKRRDAGYSRSVSDGSKSNWLLPTPVQNSGLFSRSNSNKRKNIISQDFSVNKQSKTILSSTTIATVVAKYNNNVKNIN